MKRLVVALGGHALIRPGERGTIDQQFAHMREAVAPAARLIRRGYQVVFTHGNGPIVGTLLLQTEAAPERAAPMPLYVCDAESQGEIGLLIQQTLENEIGPDLPIAAVVTQVLVDPADPAFSKPTKPVGPFYAEEEARALAADRGWTIREDAGRGWRRAVPSPRPLRIVEEEVIRRMVEAGIAVIAAGGGGIPVIRSETGLLRGVDAVIDKDLTAALLGRAVGASALLIGTTVEQVCTEYGKPNEVPIGAMTVKRARSYLEAGEFAPGSMGPKIEAAIAFLESGGRMVVITTPDKIEAGLEGKAGTRIVG
ncbi:MAG: carbamate kinase [Nitrospirae bacterium RBG_16_64_22]|nr:MAG: carbamate kinase [Nitrospirae bacterium RBG_16_64_22]